MSCSNCGARGHFFRECSEPITSLGLVIFKRLGPRPEDIRWLLICRKVSIGYIELLRGKYELRNTAGIQLLVDQMTVAEKAQLTSRTFAQLWHLLWNGLVSRRYSTEFEQAKAKFELLRSRGVLQEAIRLSRTAWTEPEWGFPKGRRSSHESELDCAFRETTEEAGVLRADLRLVEVPPFIEEYRGSNGLHYRHRYWLAEAPATLEVRMDPTNADQNREISSVCWLTLEEAQSRIRPYNESKRGVLAAAATVATATVATATVATATVATATVATATVATATVATATVATATVATATVATLGTVVPTPHPETTDRD